MRILIVAATELEVASIRPYLEPTVDVLVTGVGMVATAVRCSRALARTAYDLALNVGICGSFDRTLAPGTVVQVALLHENIMRNAPDDAVAVEIAHRHPTHRDPIAFIQPNGAIVERALVDHFILRLVAIDREVLDNDISDAGALKQ